MPRHNRLRMETLEDRVVLNGAPVLIEHLGDGSHPFSDHEWRVSQDDGSSVSVRNVRPVEDGYSGTTAQMVKDFTGDGVDDVLVQWDDGEWGLQVNDGQRLYLMPWGVAPEGNATIVETADFNNDGLEDILSYDKTTGDMWVSLNSLSEGFTNHLWTKFTPRTDWLHLFVDDFDGDGRIDVLGGESGGGWWLAKNMESTFHNHFWGRFGQHGWQDVMSDDFTGDGLPDVAARAPDNTWWLWSGTESKLEVAQYWGHWKMRDEWHSVMTADFDADGRTDLIGRSEDGLLWIGNGGEDLKTTVRGKGWIHNAEWTNVSIVDMNGDGLPDQVGRAKDNTWWYAENTGERFRNHFWQRGSADSFISTNFTRELTIDIRSVLSPDTVSAQSVGPEVSLTIDENDRIVISGNGVQLFGINLESESGSLIPTDIASAAALDIGELSTNTSAAPFQFHLNNTKYNVALGSLGSVTELKGSVQLNVGWDTSTGASDLIAVYGTPVSDGFVDVDDRLDSDVVIDQHLESNFQVYRQLRLPNRLT